MLSIDSYTTEVAPSQFRTPRRRPVYIHEEKLGKGSFGQVDRVVGVSTGAIYAHKTFHEPPWAEDTEHRRCQRKGWLDQIRREIRIMMEHSHVSMVTRAGETDADRQKRNASANDQPDLKTFCGTGLYAAPEISTGESYNTAVDIWSLGVIVLEYVYGLPTQHLQRCMDWKAVLRERGMAWCRRLVKHVNGLGSDLWYRSSHHCNGTDGGARAALRRYLFDESARAGALRGAVRKLGRRHTGAANGSGEWGTQRGRSPHCHCGRPVTSKPHKMSPGKAPFFRTNRARIPCPLAAAAAVHRMFISKSNSLSTQSSYSPSSSTHGRQSLIRLRFGPGLQYSICVAFKGGLQVGKLCNSIINLGQPF